MSFAADMVIELSVLKEAYPSSDFVDEEHLSPSQDEPYYFGGVVKVPSSTPGQLGI